MSINDFIATREHEGKLKPFVPKSRKLPKRRAFLCIKAWQELENPNSAVNLLGSSGFLRAALTKWVLGEQIYKDFFKHLDSPPLGIWEIRITQPRPQFRSFFRFAAQDTMIISGTYSRDLLGKKGSSAWKQAMDECAALWVDLFDAQPFYTGGDRSTDYVTEACDDFKIKIV